MTGFDVFLAHHSNDKPTVRRLAKALKARGSRVWYDELELVPGQIWQQVLEDEISKAKAAIVCVGKSQIGPWEALEMRAALTEFVERGTPVIPVLLPDAQTRPKLPLFLRQFKWVDFRGTKINDPQKLDHLEKGIRGPIALEPFQDRHEECAFIKEFLATRNRSLLFVCGGPASGKSETVRRVLRDCEETHERIYLDAAADELSPLRLSFENLRRELAERANAAAAPQPEVPHSDKTRASQVMEQLLAKLSSSGRDGERKPVVVFLDGFENLMDGIWIKHQHSELKDAILAVVRHHDHRVKLILTFGKKRFRDLEIEHNRQRLDSRRWTYYPLPDHLPLEYRHKLLRTAWRWNGVDVQKHLEPEEVEQICERICEREGRPGVIWMFAKSLVRSDQLHEFLVDPVPPQDVVEYAASWLFERLTPPGQLIVQAVSLFEQSAPKSALLRMVEGEQVDGRAVRRKRAVNSIKELCDGETLVEDVPDRFSIGDALFLPYVRSQLERQGALRSRLLKRGLQFLGQRRPNLNRIESLEELTPIFDEIELRCERKEYDAAAKQLFEIDYAHLRRFGRHGEMAHYHASVAPHVSDPLIQQQCLGHLAAAYYDMLKLDEATEKFTAALKLARTVMEEGRPQRRLQAGYHAARWLTNLGLIKALEGKHREADKRFREARAQKMTAADRVKVEPVLLNNLGDNYLELGELSQAEAAIDESIDLNKRQRRWNDLVYAKLTRVALLIDQGHRQKQRDEGRAHYRRAIRLAKEIAQMKSCRQDHKLLTAAYYWMAAAEFFANDLGEAIKSAAAGQEAGEEEYVPRLQMVSGLVHLTNARTGESYAERKREYAEARQTLQATCQSAQDHAIHQSRYAIAVARCGLAMVARYGDESTASQERTAAFDAFEEARRACRAKGVLRRAAKWIDRLSEHDPEKLLSGLVK